jgi:general stress protein YciG
MQQEYDEQPQFDPERDNLDTAGERPSVEMPSKTRTSGRGFAGMSQEKRRAIASRGGRAQGKAVNPGNFANNREKAVAAGQKGGRNSHGGGRQSQDTDNNDSDI